MTNTKSYATLRALITSQSEEPGQTATRCGERLARRQEFAATDAEDILADSLASCLHSFYTGWKVFLKPSPPIWMNCPVGRGGINGCCRS